MDALGWCFKKNVLAKRWVDNGEAFVWYVGITEKKCIKGRKKKDLLKRRGLQKI